MNNSIQADPLQKKFEEVIYALGNIFDITPALGCGVNLAVVAIKNSRFVSAEDHVDILLGQSTPTLLLSYAGDLYSYDPAEDPRKRIPGMEALSEALQKARFDKANIKLDEGENISAAFAVTIPYDEKTLSLLVDIYVDAFVGKSVVEKDIAEKKVADKKLVEENAEFILGNYKKAMSLCESLPENERGRMQERATVVYENVVSDKFVRHLSCDGLVTAQNFLDRYCPDPIARAEIGSRGINMVASAGLLNFERT